MGVVGCVCACVCVCVCESMWAGKNPAIQSSSEGGGSRRVMLGRARVQTQQGNSGKALPSLGSSSSAVILTVKQQEA